MSYLIHFPSCHPRTVTPISNSQFHPVTFNHISLSLTSLEAFVPLKHHIKPMTMQHEIIVVGSGVAGSAAAITLARQGYQILLLERNLQEPDRIVGELMQLGGVIALEELGLGSCLEGIGATPVRGYHIYWGDEQVTFCIHYRLLPMEHELKVGVSAMASS
jgi:hypothetical protein